MNVNNRNEITINCTLEVLARNCIACTLTSHKFVLFGFTSGLLNVVIT